MAALVGLLNNRQNDENIVGHALACLVVLCQDTSNIVKAIEMNLFTILKRLLYNDPVRNSIFIFKKKNHTLD